MYSMINSEGILKLKTIIFNELSPLINDNYSLLDLPSHGNIGDSLIAQGEVDFLSELHHKLLFTTFVDCPIERIPEEGILLFNGGGNFGDLWPGSQEFRRKIIRNRRKQRIIIFPQSIFYKNISNLKGDVVDFSQHPDLVICTRDKKSFDFCKLHFVKNKILLVPDMAFYLNIQKFDYTLVPKKQFKDNVRKVLLLYRNDSERFYSLKKAKKVVVNMNKDFHNAKLYIEDWPTLKNNYSYNTGYKISFNKIRDKIYSKFNLSSPLTSNGNDEIIDLKRYSFDLSKIGIDFIKEYDVVFSTRLHGLILCTLLGINVVGLDNSYRKLSSFYDCWLKEFEKCCIIV